MTELPWSDPHIIEAIKKISNVLKELKLNITSSIAKITDLRGKAINYIKFIGVKDDKLKVNVSWNPQMKHIELRIIVRNLREDVNNFLELLEDHEIYGEEINGNVYITKRISLDNILELRESILKVMNLIEEL